MTINQLRSLQVGDLVNWTNPDTGLVSEFFVQEIITENGLIFDFEDTLVITDGQMEVHEIYAAELI